MHALTGFDMWCILLICLMFKQKETSIAFLLRPSVGSATYSSFDSAWMPWGVPTRTWQWLFNELCNWQYTSLLIHYISSCPSLSSCRPLDLSFCASLSFLETSIRLLSIVPTIWLLFWIPMERPFLVNKTVMSIVRQLVWPLRIQVHCMQWQLSHVLVLVLESVVGVITLTRASLLFQPCPNNMWTKVFQGTFQVRPPSVKRSQKKFKKDTISWCSWPTTAQ